MNLNLQLNPGDLAYYCISCGFVVKCEILEVEISFNINNQNYWYYKTKINEYVSYFDEKEKSTNTFMNMRKLKN